MLEGIPYEQDSAFADEFTPLIRAGRCDLTFERLVEDRPLGRRLVLL
jgi:hypothetical protein